MLLTNEQREQLSQLFTSQGTWILRNNKSKNNIETCNGVATKDIKTNTCELCVAANKTAYRPKNVWTQTHPNCKCYNTNGNVSVQVDFPIPKITRYLFVDENKTKMMHKIGYRLEDSEELHQTLSAVIKKQYEEGGYTIGTLDKYGQHVQIDTIIIGKRDHEGEMHQCHAGCVLWPQGKIKVATPLVVDDI